MRIAFVGVSHWHTRLYAEPVLAMGDATVVGCSDPDPAVASRWAEEADAPAFTDYRQMAEVTRPDLVFVLGRHDEMFATASHLLAEEVPIALEKPGGVSLQQVVELQRRADRGSAFVSVALPYRCGDLFTSLLALADRSGLTYASLRYVSGPASRYLAGGVPWVLAKAHAGGGTTVNLSIHLFDLLNALRPSGTSWSVRSAQFSNRLSGAQVDDYSVVVLEADGRVAVAESGYAYPWPRHSADAALSSGSTDTVSLDIRMSLCFEDAYVVVPDPYTLVIRDTSGRDEVVQTPTSQVPYYETFVRNTVTRLRSGDPPPIGLEELVAALGLVDAAYRAAGSTFGPEPAPGTDPGV